jgi:hypothetical protein
VGKPILAALVESGGAIDEMALMLQKEVAERVAAQPGSKTYGALSVLTQVSAAVRLAFTVPPGAFSPPPQVDSAVLYLRLLREPPVPVADPARFGAPEEPGQRAGRGAGRLRRERPASGGGGGHRPGPPGRDVIARRVRPAGRPDRSFRSGLASPFLGPDGGPVVG